MRAMCLAALDPSGTNASPLRLAQLPVPVPQPGDILLRVTVCGVCHTELDEIAGRTPPSRLPIIPGHQVVGVVEGSGQGEFRFAAGDRVGVAWINSTCGKCAACRNGRENLCAGFVATGRDVDGGYAEYMTVPAAFAYPIPSELTDTEAAPLLCAGAVGLRSLNLAELEDGETLGLTGFGASGHIVLQLARHLYPSSEVYVFARSPEERAFALRLGATWAGDTLDEPPGLARAIIDTTPAWRPVLAALRNLSPGGRLVINAIRKEEQDRDVLHQLSYADHLWMEREIKSVANVTRQDVVAMLATAAAIGLRPAQQEYPLEAANEALSEIRSQRIRGAKILRISVP